MSSTMALWDYVPTIDLSDYLRPRKSFANRIEAAARRAYNEIDSAVCETGRVNAEGVELIRTAMNNTIGEYCE